MAEELVLYTHPFSRGRIARWMIEEVGAPYRTELIEYGPPMKSPEYLAINPMGKVPAITHGGRIVTEAAAICAYLADAFPDAGLAPRADERADYYRWLFYAAGPLEHAVTEKSRGIAPSEKEMQLVGYGHYDLVVDVLDALLTRQPFATGDRFTAADVALGSQIGWGLQFGTLPHRDAFDAYVARVTDRPAYVRAKGTDDALAAAAG